MSFNDLGQNKQSSRQWRHLDKLQQHDYDIKYFPGASNTVADDQSRIASTQPSSMLSPASLLNVAELRVPASNGWLDDVRKGYTEDLVLAKCWNT